MTRNIHSLVHGWLRSTNVLMQSLLDPPSASAHAPTVQQLRDRFRSLDSNGDGMISEAELTTMLADSGMDDAAAAKHAGALFARCAADASTGAAAAASSSTPSPAVHGVTYGAFLREYVRMSRFKALKAIQAQFQKIDTVSTQNQEHRRWTTRAVNTQLTRFGCAIMRVSQNGDGVLSKDELRTALVHQIGESAAQDQLDAVFAAMDANSDGSIDLHEFWAFIRLKSEERMQTEGQ